jgi:hypothetical protein
VKTETTSAANIVFTVEAGMTDGHADRFWSHALAVMAADGVVGSVMWQRIKNLIRPGRDERARDRKKRGAFG